MEFAAFPAKSRPMDDIFCSTGRSNKNGPVPRKERSRGS